MLSRKVNHRVILAGISVTALGCLVVLTIVAPNATHGDLRLSQQDMENIVGGEEEPFDDYPCCDNCADVTENYWECYHTLTAICEDDGCIQNFVDTGSCEPYQGDEADGCDAAEADPPTYALRQDFYHPGSSCSWQSDPGKWMLRHDIYYGCDTCHGFMCSQFKIAWACKVLLCIEDAITGGDELGDKYECGCE